MQKQSSKSPKQSPRISRFIPESAVQKRIAYTVFFLVSFTLSVLIVLQLIQLGKGLYVLRVAQVQKVSTTKELAYWEDVISRYPGYKDAYLKAYMLSSRLGEKDKQKQYLEEILRLDPGFVLPRE